MLFVSTDCCIAVSPSIAAERLSVQAAPVNIKTLELYAHSMAACQAAEQAGE